MFVEFIRGSISTICGGIVSFGPPLGGVVVLAHECEKIIVARMITTGTAGIRYDNILCLFILFMILKVCPCYFFKSLDPMKFLNQVLKIIHVVDVQVDESVEYSIFGAYVEPSDIYAHDL